MNKYIKRIFFAVFFIISLFWIISIISSYSISSINLIEGKNVIIFNNSKELFVKTLIELNPKIDVVSYRYDNRTIGYINIFNGVGDNFVIQPDMQYEIISKENITLILPDK